MEFVIEYDWDGDGGGSVAADLDQIGYEEADSEFEEDPKLFIFLPWI